MSGKTSRDKGKRGEQQLARILRSEGFGGARRGQQYSGANGDADVVGLPGIHAEVKRTERTDLYGWIAQADADALDGEIPAVFHRKNNSPWLAVMHLEDWLSLYREYLPAGAETGNQHADMDGGAR